jgi:DNA-binding winged helix-turn-helix (wHTH) protein
MAVFSFGPFRLHVVERLLKRGDEVVPLRGRALDLLIALLEKAGEVVARSELIKRVWPDLKVEEANLHSAGAREGRAFQTAGYLK